MDLTIVWPAIQGVGIGLITALAGYLKNKPDGAEIDLIKAAPIIIIGGIAGIIAHLNGIPLDSATELLAVSGFATVINYVWNMIVKAYENKRVLGRFVS